MPTEQRRHMAPFHLPTESESSFFTDELRLRTERQVGILKQGCFPENVDNFSLALGNKSLVSSPLENIKPIGVKVVNQLDNMQPYKLIDQKTSFVDDKLLDETRHFDLPPSRWRDDQDPALQPDSFTKALAFPLDGRRGNLNGTENERELFSSSLPDIFDKKIRLTPNSGVSGELAEKVNRNHADDEPFELTKEVEAQIIGNLLPDDDDLLSGVIDSIGYTTQTNNQDDTDDDIFYTGGGMELEGDDKSKLSEVNGGINNGQTRLNGHLSGENTYGGPPSRTLLVRNIDNSVEDYELKLIFEQYGDICTLYVDRKHHDFVVISYYDVRSAENALKGLQGKPLGHRKLDICYSSPKGYTFEKEINKGTLVLFNLDPSVTNDDLHRIFGSYGEIKEIAREDHHKFIVFYDVRAAEAARHALNRSDISGKITKMERSYSGVTNRSVTQQMSHELERKRFGVCRLGSPSTSPSTCFGSVNMTPIMSTGLENGTIRSSRVQAPTNQFREGRFLDLASIAIKSISSPVGITSAGTQSNHSTHAELSHSLGRMNEHTNGHMNYGFQEISTFPHSLPESQSGLNSVIPYNLGAITPTGTGEAMVSRHIYKGVSGNLNTNSYGHTDALCFSRVGSCPLQSQQLAQDYSYELHRQPSSPMLWPRTRPFINNVPPRPLPQVHGISAPSCMPENIRPVNHHHVGSAPAAHTPNWDRPHGYPREMIEAPGFHPGGASSIGFPGSPRLHELELNNMIPQTGGTFIESMSPAHMGSPSPRQRRHMFHGRSRMIPHQSFDSPGERMRSRRNESSPNQSDDNRQFELDIQRIARGEDTRTTLMIKNIPNKYTSKMLLSAIDETHRGTYDFIYLPIDFKNKCNVGYAFINIISPEQIIPFYKTFNGKRWEKFNSEKVASLAYARIQGKSALIAHFQNSSLMNEDKRCRPIIFHSDGPKAGDQEPFPVGTNVRTRPGRARILSWEENGTRPKRGSETPGYIARDTEPTVVA
ncbi:hypothetical protein QOZ80_4AG0319510 [Eleusine coracana subsp. coracana]|nr:hypothetical protein QOZ80_4AG0319510 [Eleusine coracana subsp. coracana]